MIDTFYSIISENFDNLNKFYDSKFEVATEFLQNGNNDAHDSIITTLSEIQWFNDFSKNLLLGLPKYVTILSKNNFDLSRNRDKFEKLTENKTYTTIEEMMDTIRRNYSNDDPDYAAFSKIWDFGFPYYEFSDHGDIGVYAFGGYLSGLFFYLQEFLQVCEYLYKLQDKKHFNNLKTDEIKEIVEAVHKLTEEDVISHINPIESLVYSTYYQIEQFVHTNKRRFGKYAILPAKDTIKEASSTKLELRNLLGYLSLYN